MSEDNFRIMQYRIFASLISKWGGEAKMTPDQFRVLESVATQLRARKEGQMSDNPVLRAKQFDSSPHRIIFHQGGCRCQPTERTRRKVKVVCRCGASYEVNVPLKATIVVCPKGHLSAVNPEM